MAVKPRRFSARFGPDFGIGRYCVATTDENAVPTSGTLGTVRLWSNQNRSGVLVHIVLNDSGNANADDENAIGAELLNRMTASGVDFATYGNGRTFHCDVHVPQALVDRYS